MAAAAGDAAVAGTAVKMAGAGELGSPVALEGRGDALGWTARKWGDGFAAVPGNCSRATWLVACQGGAGLAVGWDGVGHGWGCAAGPMSVALQCREREGGLTDGPNFKNILSCIKTSKVEMPFQSVSQSVRVLFVK